MDGNALAESIIKSLGLEGDDQTIALAKEQWKIISNEIVNHIKSGTVSVDVKVTTPSGAGTGTGQGKIV
jgi:hypothetical protein